MTRPLHVFVAGGVAIACTGQLSTAHASDPTPAVSKEVPSGMLFASSGSRDDEAAPWYSPSLQPFVALVDAAPDEPAGACVNARRLWFEDYETGDYQRWTGGYDSGANNRCQENGFDSENAFDGSSSHRSQILCRSNGSVHRGYGGLQFDGDEVMPSYTNRGVGTQAPHGMVNTFWAYLDSGYEFGNGRWFSFWTVDSDCAWEERVITLGLEDATRRLTPAHVAETGGTVTFSPDAPSFPLRQWTRITIYINYHGGEMHVWQDGESVVHGTFSRPSQDICHWHWGSYASGDNDDIVLYEDDNSLWKLEEPWTDFSVEPWFEGPSVNACQ
jgi:hypothetical protein